VIYDFDFKSFLTDFEFDLMFFGKKIILQYISFVTVGEQLLMLKTNADIWSETLMTIMTWSFPGLELSKDMLFCLLWLKYFNIISFFIWTA